jgi:hypothetical protein
LTTCFLSVALCSLIYDSLFEVLYSQNFLIKKKNLIGFIDRKPIFENGFKILPFKQNYNLQFIHLLSKLHA